MILKLSSDIPLWPFESLSLSSSTYIYQSTFDGFTPVLL